MWVESDSTQAAFFEQVSSVFRTTENSFLQISGTDKKANAPDVPFGT